MNSLKLKIRELLLVFYRGLDVIALIFALWTAFLYGSPFGTEYIANAIFEPTLETNLFFGGVLLSWSLTLSSMWLYRSKRLASWNDELFDVVKAVGYCTLLLATMILLAEWKIFPKRFLLIFAVTSFVSLFLIRLSKIDSAPIPVERSQFAFGCDCRRRTAWTKVVEFDRRKSRNRLSVLGFVDDFDDQCTRQN